MSTYDSFLPPNGVLNEQVAREIFEILPECGPIMVIIDRDGNFWPSSSEDFSNLNIDESFLKELCAKIDDGTEPVITQVNDCGIIATQLVAEKTNCGYVIIALPKYSPESTLANIDLIEILLNQTNLIAKLIEKNDMFYELQMKQQSMYSQSPVALN